MLFVAFNEPLVEDAMSRSAEAKREGRRIYTVDLVPTSGGVTYSRFRGHLFAAREFSLLDESFLFARGLSVALRKSFLCVYCHINVAERVLQDFFRKLTRYLRRPSFVATSGVVKL